MASRIHKDPLFDLDLAIEGALDQEDAALLGALYRIQGSAEGWCSHPTCGGCALARLKCISGLDTRIANLIQAHRIRKSMQNGVPGAAPSPPPSPAGT